MRTKNQPKKNDHQNGEKQIYENEYKKLGTTNP